MRSDSADSLARGRALEHNESPTTLVFSDAAPTAPSDDASLCCCGTECTQHGLRNATLKSLEKDVRDAARAGQALLVRHETCIAEYDTERSNLNSQVTRLDARNKELEAINTQLVAENTALLEQLDDLNNATRDSDAHIRTLTATLQSTQKEVDRLNRLALRAEGLEAQLLDCEKEQARLQATLTRSVEEERAAIQRWRASQRKIAELQDQIEDIEREAYDEAAKHHEVVQRLERRVALQNELGPHSNGDGEDSPDRKNGEVVSSFVKEILQDNANMQLAMSELQDLVGYYKELELVQASGYSESLDDLDRPGHPSLEEELDLDHKKHQQHNKQQQQQQQQAHPELHVHHHYHGPNAASSRQPRAKSQQAQRLKKRRPGLGSGRSTPTRASQSPSRPQLLHAATTSISSMSSFDNRVSKQKRWSAQSGLSQASFAISSGPSSPPSTSYCPSTIFERDLGDSHAVESCPTSPESNPMSSPTVGSLPGKHDSRGSGFQPMSPPRLGALENMRQPVQKSAIPTIAEQSHEHSPVPTQGEQTMNTGPMPVPLSPTRNKSPTRNRSPIRNSSPTRNKSPTRALRRTNSQTSLFSISGMDIHSTFPTSAHLPYLEGKLNARQRPAAAISTTTAAALKHGSPRRGVALDKSLRGQLEPSLASNRADHYTPITDTFGKRFGGWLSTRLASVPSVPKLRATRGSEPTEATKSTEVPNNGITNAVPPSDGLEAKSAARDVPAALGQSDSLASPSKLSLSSSPRKLLYRPPGVNQDGGLPPLPLPGGFRSLGKTPITKMMDQEALRQCLGEEENELP